MSALLYIALRRLGVANVRITPIDINVGAPAAPSLDFSVAANSMYL